MLINKEIFRAYDIRGDSFGSSRDADITTELDYTIYNIRGNADIRTEIAYSIGFCFAKIVIEGDNNKICVARDGRLSSPFIRDSLMLGLVGGGASIINLGMIPTPMLYFADNQLKPAGSIMVTGSHNPKNDNGFKMVKGSKPFFGEQIQDLLAKILNLNMNWDTWTNPRRTKPEMVKVEITGKYLTRILDGINISSKLKVAWDPGNGAAGNIIEALKKALPNNNILINSKVDGNFPSHHPDPTNPSNLQELIKVVKEQNCDIGIAFDGDGDRIGIVSSSGQILFGDQILCIFAKDILKDNLHATIILDIKSSQAIIDQIESYGGKPLLWRTGHPFIKSKMQETKALLAGEMSGHIFFADKYYGFDDAIYAALRFLELLSKSDKTIDEMINELPKSYSTPEIKIFVSPELKLQIIKEVKEILLKEQVEFNDIDGVRVSTKNGWWLLRSSNTESAIIARAESNTAEGLENLKAKLSEMLSKYKIKI